MATGVKKEPVDGRRSPRYKVDVRLRVTLQRNEGRNFTFGQGSDISEGGLSAYIPADLDVGERVGIQVTLPYSKEAISMHAEVRNKNGFRYGLQFVLITEEAQQLLRRSLGALALMH